MIKLNQTVHGPLQAELRQSTSKDLFWVVITSQDGEGYGSVDIIMPSAESGTLLAHVINTAWPKVVAL